MGIKIETIESEEQYNEFKNYIDELYNLYRMNPQADVILNYINEIKVETKKWENK